MMAIRRALAVLWVGSFLVQNGVSYSVTLEPEEEQCFIITASQGSTCAGSFEVITPNPIPIIVEVIGPKPKETVYFQSKQKEGVDEKSEKELSEGSFEFEADEEGDYSMCIGNGKEIGDSITRTVALNFRTTELEEGDYEYNGIDQELAEMRQGLDLLRDHQSYMGQREDVHRDAMDSINTKVKMMLLWNLVIINAVSVTAIVSLVLVWTIMEAIILIGMAFWQISYIRSFFETKRRL